MFVRYRPLNVLSSNGEADYLYATKYDLPLKMLIVLKNDSLDIISYSVKHLTLGITILYI